MTGGLMALAAALVVATALGLTWQRRTGRFRAVGPARAAGPDEVTVTQATVLTHVGRAPQGGGGAGDGPDVLTEADLGGQLGPQATLVQFSTAFCAPCRPTRQILAQVASMMEGVTHLDIDATSRLDLVQRLRINSTPTVLVLGPGGAIVTRASGLPRKADVIAALGTAIAPAASSAPAAPAAAAAPGAVPAAGGE